MDHFKCNVCGYEYHGDKAYDECPNCKSSCPFVDMSTDCRTNPDFCKI